MQQQLSEQQLAVVSFIARAADAHLHERIQALTLLANSIGPEAMADSAGLQHLLDSQPLLPSLFSGGVLITRADGTAVAEAPAPWAHWRQLHGRRRGHGDEGRSDRGRHPGHGQKNGGAGDWHRHTDPGCRGAQHRDAGWRHCAAKR